SEFFKHSFDTSARDTREKSQQANMWNERFWMHAHAEHFWSIRKLSPVSGEIFKNATFAIFSGRQRKQSTTFPTSSRQRSQISFFLKALEFQALLLRQQITPPR
ncbi:hypothetical protein TGFOU_403820, partial [Toxoplasma gondii FOU]